VPESGVLDMKPYGQYRDSGEEWLERIPANWDFRRMKTVLGEVVDRPLDNAKVDLLLGMENVESWTGRLIGIDDAIALDSQHKAFNSGDILFGKLRPYLAKVVRAGQPGVCVGEFLVLRKVSESAHEHYLEFLLRSQPVISKANSETFGARMPRTSWVFLGRVEIPFPPKAEQVAIAWFLDYVDGQLRRLIEAREQGGASWRNIGQPLFRRQSPVE